MDKNELKAYAKSKGVFLWEIAEKLGIWDTDFSKKLRRISDEEYAKYVEIIDDIAKRK